MYLILLPLHSLIRWLVLLFLLLSIIRAYRGMIDKQVFSKLDIVLKKITVQVLQLQFVIGVTLYFLSPLVDYFLNNFKAGVHMREIRFFGMEHVTMMVIAVAIVSIGSDRVDKIAEDQRKFKTMAIWFTIALVIIFCSIPWAFSPFTARPNFRPF